MSNKNIKPSRTIPGINPGINPEINPRINPGINPKELPGIDNNFYANVGPTGNSLNNTINRNRNRNKNKNKKENSSSFSMMSYSSTYSNVNGEERHGEQKMASDGNKTKIYRNIDGNVETDEFQGVPYSRHFNHTPSHMIENSIHNNNNNNQATLNNSLLPSIGNSFFDGELNNMTNINDFLNERQFFKNFNTSFNDSFFDDFFNN